MERPTRKYRHARQSSRSTSRSNANTRRIVAKSNLPAEDIPSKRVSAQQLALQEELSMQNHIRGLANDLQNQLQNHMQEIEQQTAVQEAIPQEPLHEIMPKSTKL